MRSEVKKTLRLKVGSVYHNLAVNVLTFKIQCLTSFLFKLHELFSFSVSVFLYYGLLYITLYTLQTNSKILPFLYIQLLGKNKSFFLVYVC